MAQPGKEYTMVPAPRFEASWYQGSGKLRHKTVIITGGDSGIGRSIAVLAAREGANITIVYLNEDIDAASTASLVEKEGGQCLLIKGDLKDPDFSDAIIGQTIKRYKRIDVLINNAAMQFPEQDFEKITREQLFTTFETNIFAYFYLSKAALPHLQQGSSIINTTSVTAYRGSQHLIDYAATKGAIVAFTRSLALNLAPKGIRVNAVAPGPVWTPLITSTFDQDKVDKFGTNVPLGRPGQPEEIAPAYIFLASQDSSYITGQVIHPNGGEIINT